MSAQARDTLENSQLSPAAEKPEKRTPLQVLGNIAAVAFAVRMGRKKGNDFREGSFKQFVFGSLVFVAIFITAVISVVKLVLAA